jgi:protein-tyrosine-phosphatase
MHADPIVWFGLGYFLCYIPYSALIRALSLGLLPGIDQPVPRFVLLPATVLATSAALLLLTCMDGGWKCLRRVRVFGLNVPVVQTSTLCSGLATAVIIATTTLNYTFAGITILLALLIMRGGVLVLAPLVDTVFGRRIQGRSWVALVLSLLAVGIAFADVGGYQMTLGAGLSFTAYLTGYIFRLGIMTRSAKNSNRAASRRYFYEETIVAAVALSAVPGLVSWLGRGEVAEQLRDGFGTFLMQTAALPALAIGLCYASLYVFGTKIYLDHRENAFCIPFNRCSSLLSGVVASYGLIFWLGAPRTSGYQLVGVILCCGALVCLMSAAVHAGRSAGHDIGQRLFLFVCSGNTSRSPIAQALCNHYIAQQLGLAAGCFERARARAESAGLSAQSGRPFATQAVEALRRLGVVPHAHAARDVTADLVRQAEVIFCMTEDQCRALLARFPEAAAKSHRLDPEGDIEDPSGSKDATVFDRVSEQLSRTIRLRLELLDV